MPVAVEGPYGGDSEYYLNYMTLVLVAGGIGITPFMAIIQDVLHRYRITPPEERDRLPKNIVLIWSVRSETELDILRQVSPSLVFKDYESGACRIHVKAYVTRFQTNKAYVDDHVDNNLGGAIHVIPAPGPDDDLTNTSGLRSVTGTGDNLWMFWMIFITTCATVATFEGINVVLPQNVPHFQWIQVTLLFVSMFVGIVVAGSAVLSCWTAHSKSKEKQMMENQARAAQVVVGLYKNELCSVDDVEWAHPTLYDMAEGYMFARPDFSREFDQVVKDFGHEDVGVLVSGPEGLQHVVAKECQRRSGLQATLKAENFNYHSVSFSL